MSGPTLPVPFSNGDAARAGGKKPPAPEAKAAPAFQALLDEAGMKLPPALGVAAEEDASQKPRLGALLRGTAWPLTRDGGELVAPEEEVDGASAVGHADVLEVDGEASLSERLAQRLLEAMTAPGKAGASMAAQHFDASDPIPSSVRRSEPSLSLDATRGAERAAPFSGASRPLEAKVPPTSAVRVTHRETHFAPAPQRSVDDPGGPPPRAEPADRAVLNRRISAEARESELLRAADRAPTDKATAEPVAARDPALPGAANSAPSLPATTAERSGEGRGAAHPAAAQEKAQPAGGPVKVLHLQLQPADLGELTVKMRLTEAGLEVHLEATRPETAVLLKQDRDAIARLLKASGYAAESVTVAMADKATVTPQQSAVPEGSARQPDGQASSSGAGDRGGRSDGRAASHPGGREGSGGMGDEPDQDRGAPRRPGDLYL